MTDLIRSIRSICRAEKVTVAGRVTSVGPAAIAGPALEVGLADHSGRLFLVFYGRERIPGLVPGTVLKARGRVGDYRGALMIANPWYELEFVP